MARANGSTSGAKGAAGRSRAVTGPAKFMGFLGGPDCGGKSSRRPGSWVLLYLGPDLRFWEIEMAAAEDSRPWPTELRLAKDRRSLTVTFEGGESYAFEAEYLRVLSPSAEVQGHSPEE